MKRGLDTTAACGAAAKQIKAVGNDFVFRYLPTSAWKGLTLAEASAVSAAGLMIGSIFEASAAGPMKGGGQGTADGQRASRLAAALRQPPGTAIYFAVDLDVPTASMPAVCGYFVGVLSGLKNYVPAVYGSGEVCDVITSKKLARYAWMAQARGWAGTRTFHGWNVDQAMPAMVCGLAVDPCESAGDDLSSIGLWQLTQPIVPKSFQPLIGLRRGTHSAEVAALQHALTGAGYGLVADGVFGSKTENAVLAFRRHAGLAGDTVDGDMLALLSSASRG